MSIFSLQFPLKNGHSHGELSDTQIFRRFLKGLIDAHEEFGMRRVVKSSHFGGR